MSPKPPSSKPGGHALGKKDKAQLNEAKGTVSLCKRLKDYTDKTGNAASLLIMDEECRETPFVFFTQNFDPNLESFLQYEGFVRIITQQDAANIKTGSAVSKNIGRGFLKRPFSGVDEPDPFVQPQENAQAFVSLFEHSAPPREPKKHPFHKKKMELEDSSESSLAETSEDLSSNSEERDIESVPVTRNRKKKSVNDKKNERDSDANYN